MALVTDVRKFSITLASGSATATADITGMTTAYCVPFITVRATGSPTSMPHNLYSVDAYFSGTNLVVATNSGTSRAMIVEATVVQFNPTEATVYQPTWTGDGTAKSIGGTVVIANTFLYTVGESENTSTSFAQGLLRTSLESTTTYAVERNTQTGAISGHTYVVESDGTAFTVQRTATTWGSDLTADTLAITQVEPTKSFLLASLKLGAVNESTEIPYYYIDGTGQNVGFVRADNNQTAETRFFVITFATGGDQLVQRGIRHQASSLAAESFAVTTVTNESSSMAHVTANGWKASGQATGITAADAPDIYNALDMTDGSTLRIQHNTTGGEADIDISWEVIEWDTAAAGGGSRRVMVIS